MAQPTMSSSTTGALVRTRDRCQSSPAGTAWMPGTSARTGAPGTRDIGGRKGAELLISKIIPPRKATPFLGQSALDWMLAGKVDEGSIAGRSPGQDWDAGIHFRNLFRGGSRRTRTLGDLSRYSVGPRKDCTRVESILRTCLGVGLAGPAISPHIQNPIAL